VSRAELVAAIAKHRPMMLRFACKFLRRLARDGLDPEDVVQEACLEIVKSADDFRGDSSLRTWMMGIVRNAALQAVRRHRQKARSLELHLDPRDFDSLASDRGGGGDPIARRRILATPLTPAHCEALVRWTYGERASETSRALGIPSATVITRRFYALSYLRRALCAGDIRP
jgi:RNA polymerase sigma-70 factor (ECF subfamily)